MSDLSTTSRDRSLFAFVLVPIVALVAFVACAAANWKVEESKIRPMLLQTFPPRLIDAPSPLAVDYMERTSTDQTAAYRELGYATDALNDKYQLMFEVLDDQREQQNERFTTESEEHPVDQYIDNYLVEAQPLLEMIEELKPEVSSIWSPQELGNPNHWDYDGSLYAGLLQLLVTEFHAAVRLKQTDRAIRSLSLLRGIDPPLSDERQLEPLVADSMGTGIWNEAELDQITQVLDDEQDLNVLWRKNIHHTQLTRMPWLFHGLPDRSNVSEPIPTLTAPSRRAEWLRRYQEYADVRGVGSVGVAKKVDKILGESREKGETQMDVTLQCPTYGGFTGERGSKSGLALMYAKVANQRRLARTAVAIATYKVKFGSYPKSLDALSKVGLPSSETLDPNRQPFLYVVVEDGCRLSNGATWFANGRGSPSRSVRSPAERLSTVLHRYREIAFRSTDG